MNEIELSDSEKIKILNDRLYRVETVLIENKRGTTNQTSLWDKTYEALKGQ